MLYFTHSSGFSRSLRIAPLSITPQRSKQRKSSSQSGASLARDISPQLQGR